MHNRSRSIPSRAAVLLATASAGGTIAAVRHLGMEGFKVSVVSSENIFGAAAGSRWAFRSHWLPPESDYQNFLEKLLAIGAANPGQILLPSSDETVWLYTENAAQLGKYFRVYQPPIETIRRLLDKKLFADAATKAGIATLPMWDPRNLNEVVALAPSLPYPILIKPRTHVHRFRNDKGMVVNSAGELIQQYQRFIGRELADVANDPALSQARLPILQRFVSVGSEGVYSVTGFIDRTGDLFVSRHATKVFQRSQPVGVGVCFESRPSDPELSESVRRLCRDLGYFGMFEVEFLWFEGRWTAIDFNPRLYNQVGLDVRRGMPLPLLACLDAAGDTACLRDAVANAQAEKQFEKPVFCDRFTLNAILLAQTLTLRHSHKGRAYWRAWLKQNAANLVDVAIDKNDWMPGIIHAISEVYLGLKALPRFLGTEPRSHSLPMPSFLKRLYRA